MIGETKIFPKKQKEEARELRRGFQKYAICC
jgi:hypothetical protein